MSEERERYEASKRLLLDALDTAEKRAARAEGERVVDGIAFRAALDEQAHRREVAESQRDTLRTALIEAQSWIDRLPWYRQPPSALLARIREALEASK